MAKKVYLNQTIIVAPNFRRLDGTPFYGAAQPTRVNAIFVQESRDLSNFVYTRLIELEWDKIDLEACCR